MIPPALAALTAAGIALMAWLKVRQPKPAARNIKQRHHE